MFSRASYGAVQLLLFLTLLPLLFKPSLCSPTNAKQRRHELEDLSRNEKRQSGFFSVLGIAGLGNTSLQPRLEIRELERNADQWNVYLLGLLRFQNTPQTEKLSYYQVAGIHGRPYIAWDSVNPGQGGSGGYCAHGSNIFSTWHRPYLALFEALLYLNARQAIAEFPNGDQKDRYNAALSTFRMPYWDWAGVPPTGEGSLPWSVQRPKIDVIMANGTNTVDNPLFSYKFHPLSQDDMVDAPWTTYPSTLRDPSSTDANAASRNDLIALQLDSNRANIQSRVYNILSMQHDYVQISNDMQPGDSIESVHDTIHNAVGSTGHMSFLAYAAFDPIFWLHHTNVDRIFAIWQAINPDSYVTPANNPYATFTTPGNSVADINSPLTPFHRNDAGEFWTSDGVRSIGTFGYTYPELAGFNPNDTSSLVNKVNALYGPNATPQKRSTPPDLIERSLVNARGIAGAPNFSGQRQYTTNIKVEKFGLDGSFNIYVFLGDEPNNNTQEWSKCQSFIGVTGILCQSGTDGSRAGVEANGAVPLTAALEAKVRSGELESMNEDSVAKYLKGHLKWRISKMDGAQIPVENAPGFQISVLWAEVEPATSANDFPKIKGGYQVLVEATDGRPGGFWKGDKIPLVES